MRISSKGKYAISLMVELALHSQSENISLKVISMRHNLSLKYLEQVATQLTKSRLIASMRGSQGGYFLTKKVDEYTIGDILRVTEGELFEIDCIDIFYYIQIKFLIDDIGKAFTSYVDNLKLSDVQKAILSYGYDYQI